MNKELEALKELTNYQCITTEYFNTLVETLEKALTPPTAEEVCDELSKLIGNAYYENKIFYENELKIEEICYLARDMGKNIDIIRFNNYSLPPHIITMIGRFYEGLENE